MTAALRSLFPRIQRPIRSLFYPQRPPTWQRYRIRLASSSTNRPLGRERLNTLVSDLQTFLGNVRDPKLVEPFVHGRLDQFFRATPERHIAYAKAISCLAENRHLKEAASVYERMTAEGLLPSPQTQTEMLAIGLVLSSSDPSISQALEAIIKHPSYNEDQFLHLLHIMTTIGVPHEHVLRVIDQFVDTQGQEYSPSRSIMTKLVGARAGAGLLDDALESAMQLGEREDFSPTESYVTIMKALTGTDPSDTASFTRALQAMKDNEVKPDIAIMNALISRELRRRSLQGAFSMYLVIMKLSLTSSFSPNRTTFGILFSALSKLYRPNLRSPGSDKVISPRQLYRDLLFFRERTSFEMTSRLLNIALRAFIQTQDYAGVYVVLRTFGIFRLPVSTKTYLIVTRHIIKRLRWDISKAYKVEEPRWGNLFLGIPEVWALHKLNKQSDRELVEKILASAAWSDFPLTGPLLGYTSEDKEVAYTTPTTAMINGEAVVPERMRFQLLPLQRIIRRAILASAATDGDDLPAAKRVSRAIVEAKAQMFPGTEHPYATKD